MSAQAFRLMADAVELLRNKLAGYAPISDPSLPDHNPRVTLAKIYLAAAVKHLRDAADDESPTGAPHVETSPTQQTRPAGAQCQSPGLGALIVGGSEGDLGGADCCNKIPGCACCKDEA